MAEARTPDGKRLINHSDWPLVMSDLIRGNGSTRSNDGDGSPRSTAEAQLAKINKILAKDPQRYFREKWDEKALALRRQTTSNRSADEVAGKAPVSRREAEILEVMNRDVREYFKRGLDQELANIRAAKAARGG
jgi:hypothetical protein